ncbi:hypothetical protein [Edaphobacter bradus]|uniref:hypothetical protein n=1 Tax=Edaphobacter bradus TaxID=2259016 RepID=UPI0021DFC480|nr:hypothetical protein [Edaphobacter bradus]
MLETVVGAHSTLSKEEKTAIQDQLERLLANPHFSHSRRFPSFLRYIIERTLSGQTDLLKERTLGIEIFGRASDYDTALDPIVRVTAAEIRKRIAQYYQEPGHDAELRISLPPGSYIPQFGWPQTAREEMPTAANPVTEPEDSAVGSHGHVGQSSRPIWRNLSIATAVALGILLIAAALWKVTQPSTAGSFWSPVLHTSDPVLFCVADQSQYSAIALRDALNPSHQVLLKDNLTALVIDDLRPIVKIAGLLQSNGKKYSLRGEGSTNLTDLRNGPNVFIGAFDNAWTLRLTRSLRYRFYNNPEMTTFGIVDNSAPSQPRWVVNRTEQMSTNNYRDYAIVARFEDGTTGKLSIVVAGIGRGGTIVAGEFLTDPDDQAQLARAALLAGKKQNMEIVLSTQIIDGEPGTPKIEATYFW